MLLDYGVIGFLLFFGMLIYAAGKMIQVTWRNPSGELDLALPLACAIVIAAQVRFVLSQVDNLPIIYLLLGMAAGLAWRARQLEKDSAVAHPAHATG